MLGSVTLQKIPWKLTSRSSWHFNRMSDSEEDKNKVRRGKKKPPTVELVQIRQMTAPGYIKHWNRSVSHLTNKKECSEKYLCRQCRK